MSKASKLYRNRFATYAAIVAVIFATAYWLKNDFDNKQRNAQACKSVSHPGTYSNLQCQGRF
jgi:hypothetical protein